ncbi:U4/U6 small nuclear ribonucleoprotein PRP4-like protein [Tanacetum coccineum]
MLNGSRTAYLELRITMLNLLDKGREIIIWMMLRFWRMLKLLIWFSSEIGDDRPFLLHVLYPEYGACGHKDGARACPYIQGPFGVLSSNCFPSIGEVFGTASFDKTWGLWDTETGDELLYQEGHSQGVYGLAFHLDGSLAASCGLDALARVWDLRVTKKHSCFLMSRKAGVWVEGLVECEEDNFQNFGYESQGEVRLREGERDHHLDDAEILQNAKSFDMVSSEIGDAEILPNAKSFDMVSSEIGDDRPLSGCSFASDGKFLATCSLSGVSKIWSIMQPQVNMIHVSSLVRYGHTARATDIAFSPTNDHIIATASADRTAKLWNTHGTWLSTYKGHLDCLARVAFHPSGKYLGTASLDKTWRLWDTETGEELLCQVGHSRGVYGLAFHPDGSLAASCGLDALARVWDLRTGESLLALEGHVKPVLEGYFLVTASHDKTAKVWSSRDFKPVKVLSGHESRVTSVDIVADGQSIATVSHDRTIKLWSTKKAERYRY